MCKVFCSAVEVAPLHKSTSESNGFDCMSLSLVQAQSFTESNITEVSSYEELKAAIAERKWARGAWAGDAPFCAHRQLLCLLLLPHRKAQAPHYSFTDGTLSCTHVKFAWDVSEPNAMVPNCCGVGMLSFGHMSMLVTLQDLLNDVVPIHRQHSSRFAIMVNFVQGLMRTRQRLRRKQVLRSDVYRLINLAPI